MDKNPLEDTSNEALFKHDALMFAIMLVMLGFSVWVVQTLNG
jgi:hypothetical protein